MYLGPGYTIFGQVFVNTAYVVFSVDNIKLFIFVSNEIPVMNRRLLLPGINRGYDDTIYYHISILDIYVSGRYIMSWTVTNRQLKWLNITYIVRVYITLQVLAIF